FGMGIRVIHKGKLGFYSTNEADPEHAIEQAFNLAKANPNNSKIQLKKTKTVKEKIINSGRKSIADRSIDNDAEFVKEIEKTAKISPLLKSIQVKLGNVLGNHVFANTEDSEIQHKGGRTITYVFLTAKDKGKLEQTVFRRGAKSFSVYKNYEDELRKKAQLAVDLLSAKKPPAGKFNAILDPESTGVFAHEALGHAAEADLVLQNSSILKGKINKKIASTCVNISDDSTIPTDKWGSYKYDNEGVLGRKTEIIKNGILKSFLHSRETASKMNTKLTGNARAQDFSFLPIVRMSNTSFESGKYSFNELVEQLKDGYYLVGFKAGQVGTLEGTFTFASDHCFRVKGGEVKELLKGCTFGGKTLEMLKKISAIQKGKRDFSIGWCGKNGQRVPVTDGGTHILVKDLYVGGEE
ncbi:TldD/PmbA family protein, partial [Candidatus Woesearchaeota archaeon]|nr:TldD/PmbA family protein [Candidatus Woesearchaeota archaeon]